VTNAEFCEPCKSRGKLAGAHRRVGSVLKCDACWRNGIGIRPAEGHEPEKDPPETIRMHAVTRDDVPPREKAAMPVKPPIDWNRAQNMRSEGVAVTEIAEQLGCSAANVYLNTKAVPGTKPVKNHNKRLTKSANGAGKIRFVDLSEVPGLRWTHDDPDYEAIWAQLKICPKGKAVCTPIPARLRNDPEPQKNLGGAMRRCAKRDGVRLSLTCTTAAGFIYVVARKKA
jgi:hypothetical protein